MIEISKAVAADIIAIEDITKACELAPWNASDYISELSRPDSIFLKAALGDIPCSGFILGRIIPGVVQDAGVDAEIYNIGVHPGRQQQGIGSKLIETFLEECQNRSVHSVWLEVRSGNLVAISFYSEHLFDVIAVRRSFYRDPVEDAIVMRSNIYNVGKI
ncbi:MAG TPA: ribosomal protein S18-alanine N-acetyltransferase [Pyrinomonadaceae bacterium]|jgi:ribosomal-protein-alanine N-acetyltransferase|nr:ribosomal protein S18-alanine N-acetyltransferase [Pyrinomonadaceae bacterium]